MTILLWLRERILLVDHHNQWNEGKLPKGEVWGDKSLVTEHKEEKGTDSKRVGNKSGEEYRISALEMSKQASGKHLWKRDGTLKRGN